MNLVRLVCLVIIAISVISFLSLVYNYIQLIKAMDLTEISTFTHETINMLVFISLFVVIISFAAHIMLKFSERKTFESEISDFYD